MQARSGRIRFRIAAGMLLALQPLAAQSLPDVPDVDPAGLPGPPGPPRAARFDANPRMPHLVPFQGRKSKADMEKAAGYLAFLTRRGRRDNRPYYQLKLGQFLTDLGWDRAACGVLTAFLSEDVRRLNPDIPEAPDTYSGLFRMALLHEMRILARNGRKDVLQKFFSVMQPRSGYEHVLLAETHMLNGDVPAATAHLDSACASPAGHPESAWGAAYIPMRAAVMACVMGDPESARKWGGPLDRRGADAEKWPQWKSAWRIVHEALEQCNHPMMNMTLLPDGSYQGTCTGFIDSVTVEIRIRDGAPQSVRILRGIEDRPYSALEIVPERIQSLRAPTVDCVTGATVTSCAVILAAVKAIRQDGSSPQK